MTREFTGRDMTVIMIAFFAVVISVNVVMARSAISTFGGVVVDNSYVASQQFNTWLRDGETQDRLGWSAHVSAAGDRIVVTLVEPRGKVSGSAVSVEAEHPLGRIKGQRLQLTEPLPGTYTATHALPPGRWRLRIEAQAPTGTARFVQDLRL